MKDNQAATIYKDVLAAMERRAPVNKIQPLIKSLVDLGHIDLPDTLGLTIGMHAAALGNLDVVKAIHKLKPLFEVRNKLTKANLLHYAAQQPNGGAAIIKWAILEKTASDDLLGQQILVPGAERDTDKDWDRGNGHTVAGEAVFNNNVGVVEALIEIDNPKGIDKPKGKVDFTTPAVHGTSPLGWALNNRQQQVVDKLKSHLRPNSTDAEASREENESTRLYAEGKDDKWRSSHPQDGAALDLAKKLRQYIVKGPTQGPSVGKWIDQAFEKEGVKPNDPYGRFGQPLLILVPTHPDIMSSLPPDKDQQERYTEVVNILLERGADPRTREKGLMEVSAGFREVFFGYMDALERMIESVPSSEREDFVNEQGLFNGYTRLIDAALIGREEAIELLLKHHLERRIKGFNGWTAYNAAEIYNNNKVPGEAKISDKVLNTLV